MAPGTAQGTTCCAPTWVGVCRGLICVRPVLYRFWCRGTACRALCRCWPTGRGWRARGAPKNGFVPQKRCGGEAGPTQSPRRRGGRASMAASFGGLGRLFHCSGRWGEVKGVVYAGVNGGGRCRRRGFHTARAGAASRMATGPPPQPLPRPTGDGRMGIGDQCTSRARGAAEGAPGTAQGATCCAPTRRRGRTLARQTAPRFGPTRPHATCDQPACRGEPVRLLRRRCSASGCHADPCRARCEHRTLYITLSRA